MGKSIVTALRLLVKLLEWELRRAEAAEAKEANKQADANAARGAALRKIDATRAKEMAAAEKRAALAAAEVDVAHAAVVDKAEAKRRKLPFKAGDSAALTIALSNITNK